MKQELRREVKTKDVNLGFINIGMIFNALRMDESTWRWVKTEKKRGPRAEPKNITTIRSLEVEEKLVKEMERFPGRFSELMFWKVSSRNEWTIGSHAEKFSKMKTLNWLFDNMEADDDCEKKHFSELEV